MAKKTKTKTGRNIPKANYNAARHLRGLAPELRRNHSQLDSNSAAAASTTYTNITPEALDTDAALEKAKTQTISEKVPETPATTARTAKNGNIAMHPNTLAN